MAFFNKYFEKETWATPHPYLEDHPTTRKVIKVVSNHADPFPPPDFTGEPFQMAEFPWLILIGVILTLEK